MKGDPMFTISKEFAFSAAHVLHGLRDGHPCGRLHGHNYVVRVELRGEALDEHGFLLDYGDLSPFRHFIDDTLDHRNLNDVVPGQPSAERLAAWLCEALRGCVAIPPAVAVSVAVSETPKTWATWAE